MVNILDYDFKTVDVDLGEMFLNFSLDPAVQVFSGVDLTPYKSDLVQMHPELKRMHYSGEQKGFEDPRLVAVWNRSWMGYKPSPYGAIRIYYHAEEFIVGNTKGPNNPFCFDTVVLNMPGNDNYNPALRRVYKFDTVHNRPASDMKIYVDDLRTAGATRELAWAAARQATSRLQFLGIQDAPRKRRLDNGPWAGGIFSTSEGQITKSVTDTKWTKGREIIKALVLELKESPNKFLEFKRLERDRGFLCHMAMTFDQIFPYLKGFHLSICGHLRYRNEEGWKTQELEWIGHVEKWFEEGRWSREEADEMLGDLVYNPKSSPEKIQVVPRFHTCLKALWRLFEQEEAHLVLVRTKIVYLLLYGFADASGTGFGSTFLSEEGVRFRIGTWEKDVESNSSNWKEFENVVKGLELEGSKGLLTGASVFLATNNTTVEGCLYKGNSTSEKLFDLVVRMKSLELKYGCQILVTKVSGLRMIAQGTDGVSRGQWKEGVTGGV